MTGDFIHVFDRGEAKLPVLLLLHGTGGDENDLVGLATSLVPGAGILSVRGKVTENGAPRFFRRLAEGVFDQEDLAFRTQELAGFIRDARIEYGLAGRDIVALGYSNGANIAASLLLAGTGVLDGAVLLRPMVPFTPEALPDLKGKRVLLLAGAMDPIVLPDNSARLARLLREAGADVQLAVKPAGHGLTQSDFADVKNWFGQ